ncbi:hypothetical protein PLICRDRAFT_175555 [Plicaturopsis crispa FD-325 SS-3]|nr:hypothetical protein PLICRDRAFT_175555 [Plicaturopsis crispa FD-325 SS-3]
MSSAAVGFQPNHRKAEPGPPILRLARTNSPLRPRDAPEQRQDPLADINARFEKLGRPRMSREDYYGPRACADSSEYAQPTGLSDELMRRARLLNNQRDATVRRNDGDEQNKRPSIREEEIVPVSGLTTTGPHPPPLTKGGLIASASMPLEAGPESVAHKKAVTFSSERTPSRAVRRPHRQSISLLTRPRRDQPDYSRDVFKDAVASRWLSGNAYGLVLQPTILPHVDTCLELNPLLRLPSLNESPNQHRINWEMVFPSTYARCSHAVSETTWSEYLHSPATSPRLRKIYILSKSFPWLIFANPEDANVGVTCGDIIDAIYSYLLLVVRQNEIRYLASSELDASKAAYVHHRTRKDAHGEPAASLMRLSAAMRRIDWLASKSFFRGLDRDDAYVAHRFGTDLPAAFILHSQELAFGGS